MLMLAKLVVLLPAAEIKPMAAALNAADLKAKPTPTRILHVTVKPADLVRQAPVLLHLFSRSMEAAGPKAK
jgi:hypothetical protein